MSSVDANVDKEKNNAFGAKLAPDVDNITSLNLNIKSA